MITLVTGAAGYIGSRLCQKLSMYEDRVIGVDNLMHSQSYVVPTLLGCGVEFHNMDIRSDEFLKLVRKADRIIHLAAMVGAPLCDKHPEDAQQVNADATVRLARAVCKSQEFVYACTNSCYGDMGGQEVDESVDDVQPLSLYAKTKMEGERAVIGAGGISLRLATVYGVSPRMRFDLMVNDFVRNIFDNSELTIYEPWYYRNAVGIDDVVAALLRADLMDISKAIASRGKLLVSNPVANLTKRELALLVCDLLGNDRSIVKVGAGEDPDKRNCKVRSRVEWPINHGLDKGILEVANLCAQVVPEGRKGWGNG